jgi:hypothetical protein
VCGLRMLETSLGAATGGADKSRSAWSGEGNKLIIHQRNFRAFRRGGTVIPLALIPFIKRGTMSAIDGTNSEAIVLYVDGFNNPGFSGGPIIFWSFVKHTYQIIGVVRGYREDRAKVLVNGQHVDTQFLVNSGILIGYSINHAIQAIERGQMQRP